MYDDVRMAVKCDPDSIYIDGMEGSTGAGPHLATEETGVPGMAAIRQARRAIDDLGKRGEISLVYAGGIRNGGDVAKALALGADAISLGHSMLMALNCNKDIPEADYEAEMGVEAGYCLPLPYRPVPGRGRDTRTRTFAGGSTRTRRPKGSTTSCTP